MEKLDEFLNKNIVRVIWVIGVLLVMGYFRGCGYSNDVDTTKENSEVTVKRLDSLIQSMPDIKQTDKLRLLQMEKIVLEATRNMLFNENAIDQRKLTADQILNDYNKRIQEIDNSIKKLMDE